MKCRDVVELMTDYLEGALSPSDRRRFEDHIAGCDGCRAYLDQMRATRSLTVKLAEEPMSKELQDELTRAFRNWRSDKNTGRTERRRPPGDSHFQRPRRWPHKGQIPRRLPYMRRLLRLISTVGLSVL